MAQDELELDGARVAFDAEATREATARMNCGAAEACGCGSCREFLDRRDGLLGAELCELLRRLGCDPHKEWELTPLRRGPGLLRELELAWRFRGELLAPGPADAPLRVVPDAQAGLLRLELRVEFQLPEPAK